MPQTLSYPRAGPGAPSAELGHSGPPWAGLRCCAPSRLLAECAVRAWIGILKDALITDEPIRHHSLTQPWQPAHRCVACPRPSAWQAAPGTRRAEQDALMAAGSSVPGRREGASRAGKPGRTPFTAEFHLLADNLAAVLRKPKCHQLTPEMPQHHLSGTLNKTQGTLGERTGAIS